MVCHCTAILGTSTEEIREKPKDRENDEGNEEEKGKEEEKEEEKEKDVEKDRESGGQDENDGDSVHSAHAEESQSVVDNTPGKHCLCITSTLTEPYAFLHLSAA